MDDFSHLCPVCKDSGTATFLQLRQINLTSAVYLCKNLKCTYPNGFSWIFVDRRLSEDEEDSDSDLSDIVNEDIEIYRNKSRYVGDKPEINYEDFLTNRQVVVNSVEQMNNVVIEDPNDLISSLGLPTKVHSRKKIDVLATGDSNSSVVDLKIPETKKELFNFDIQIKNNGNVKVLHINNKKAGLPNVFKTKLRVKTNEEKPNIYFPESVLEEAKVMEKALDDGFTKKKPTLVQKIFKKESKKDKKTASTFAGFKFESKIIKPPGTPPKKNKESLWREVSDYFADKKNSCTKLYEDSSRNSSLSETDSENISDTHDSIENTDQNMDNTNITNVNTSENNLELANTELNDLLDNLDTTNVPGNLADIAEVDAWLNTLCQ